MASTCCGAGAGERRNRRAAEDAEIEGRSEQSSDLPPVSSELGGSAVSSLSAVGDTARVTRTAPWLLLAVVSAACSGHGSPAARPGPEVGTPPAELVAATGPLRAPADFTGIADRTARSRALFGEMARVLTHPRCVNCHPADDSPRQRDARALHDPPVTRGPYDSGVPGMLCTTCHQDRNAELARVPGAPGWRLAPKAAAWLGHSPAEICAQLSDRARNGGRTLAQIQDHLAHDAIVGWGWAPGADRVPAPGTQALLGELAQAWIDTGAACPPEKDPSE